MNGKTYVEPGSYAITVYQPTSVVNVASFGRVMIIDTGLSQEKAGDATYEFAGGAGIAGVDASGRKAIYAFENFEDFSDFMGGGMITDLAQKLFTPIDGSLGTPRLYYTRAAATVPAKLTIGSGNNSIVLTCLNEGVVGNGIAEGDMSELSNGTLENLKVGYALAIKAGVDDTSKFIATIYRGNYRGTDAAGDGTYTLAQAYGEMVAQSGEIGTYDELYNWLITSSMVMANFRPAKGSAFVGTTAIEAMEPTAFAGGTTSYQGSKGENEYYPDVLEAIRELEVTFFLCTDYGVVNGTKASSNGKLFTFLKNDAKFDEFMFVAGGEGKTDLLTTNTVTQTSQALAVHYNDEKVIIVHGSPTVARKDGNGTKNLPSIYLAAAIMGLNAGMAAQTPVTFKRVGYDAYAYDLTFSERVKALQAGIMHVREVSGYYRVNQGITSLQNNKQTIAEDGQTFELSIALIKAQLNKELILDAQTRFTGNTAAQASPNTVKDFTETKLTSLVAKVGDDNLIISWKNVKVSAKNGDYKVTYDFVPNVPVNKTFFVGNMLDYVFNS
jgi:hypothetical protein